MLAPDGRSVAITGTTNMSRSLWVRRLDGDEIIQITEPALSSSAFSPDSTTVAVLSGRGLVSASLVDGERRVLTPAADITGRIAWGGGHLIFARAGSLWAVPETGGEPRSLTTLDASRGEILHGGQIVLPGTGIVLFVSSTGQPGAERIESVPIADGTRTVILDRATAPVWSPTGHLLFARDGAVLAVPFDRETATLLGTARPVIPTGRVAESASGSLALHVADDGTLAYQPRDSMDSRLLAVARNGAAVPLELPPARYHNPRMSPDGRRVMVETDGALLELLDLDRQSRTRLGEPAPGTQFATWSRDGRSVLVRRLNTLVWLSADGSSPGGLVAGAGPSDFPSGPGPDMESFLVTRVQPDTGGDVFLISTAGSVPRPLIATPGYEGGAQLSPDGRWLVYVSNVAGRSEILVRGYPSLDRPWLVSDGEGIQPRWSSDGREIFYRDGTSMVAVAFDGTRAEPVVGKAVRLFRDEYTMGMGITNANYDVTPDGRFLMLRRDGRGPALRVVLGWATDMARALADR